MLIGRRMLVDDRLESNGNNCISLVTMPNLGLIDSSMAWG